MAVRSSVVEYLQKNEDIYLSPRCEGEVALGYLEYGCILKQMLCIQPVEKVRRCKRPHPTNRLLTREWSRKG